jgi:tRNA threonylcarbamoyl adenosine modification protein (Sua5/YciO/YrdC/YwlC family)/dephospho-CoA kinase
VKTKVFYTASDEAARIIKNGGLVAVPTETVYGLCANALDEKAVKKIFELKGRDEKKPMALMISGAEDIGKYALEIPAAALILADKFWPGPLTIVLKAREFIPENLKAFGSTIGLRCPDKKITLELLKKCSLPLAGPSANPSGEKSPVSAKEVLSYFDGKIDAVIDGGESELKEASTLISLAETPFKILRHGALPESEIVDALISSMKIIGLSGRTGSGKTTALKVAEDMGALALDCDKIYSELTESSEDLKSELTAEFGDVYIGNTLDRKKLANKVFGDEKALKSLNRISHKYVGHEVLRRLGAHAMQGGKFAAIDAVELFAGNVSKLCTKTFALISSYDLQIERIMKRDGISEEMATKRLNAQKPDSYYIEKSDDVIESRFDDIDEFTGLCKQKFKEVFV